MSLTIRTSLLVVAGLTITSSAALAQDVTFEQLLQRLQSTEQRLQELESQGTVNTFPASYQNGDPLAVPPPTAPTEPMLDSEASESTDKFEARLKKLEEGWEELDDAWSAFDKAEKKKKSDAAKKPTFKINGRVHADFWSFTNDDDGEGFLENPIGTANAGADPQDRFAFRRVRLETKGDIFENMLWRLQVEFSDPNSTQFRDVYLGFKNLPNNQTLLIGNQKRPLGLDHLNSSRYNVFLERPNVIEAFNEDARRPGVAVYGYSDDLKYNWRYGVYYLENIQNDGEAIGDSKQLSGNFRLASSPWYDETSGGRGYWHWAVAGQVARPDGNRTADEDNQNDGRFRTRPEARTTNRFLDTGRIDGAEWFQTAAVESLFNVGPLQITGEYQATFLQREGFQDVNFHGGYVYVSYILTGEHIPYDRKSGTIGRLQPAENFFLVDRTDGSTGRGWGAWGIAARYSYLDLTDKDIQGGVGSSATLALNWYWNAYSKVQFNAIYGNIDERDATTGTTGADYLIFGTRFAVEF